MAPASGSTRRVPVSRKNLRTWICKLARAASYASWARSNAFWRVHDLTVVFPAQPEQLVRVIQPELGQLDALLLDVERHLRCPDRPQAPAAQSAATVSRS
jgi:hypothetical protein